MAHDFLEINRITREGRPARWGIDYYSPWDLKPDGTKERKKRFFRTKKERDDEIDALLQRYAKFGESAGGNLTPGEVEDYRAARALLPAGVMMREAARLYVKQVRPDTPLLSEVFTRYLASLAASGVSKEWIGNVKSTCKAFLLYLPEGTRIGDVGTERGRAWMKSLEPKFKGEKQVAGYADESRNNYRRRLHAAWEFAIAEKEWTHITENPFARVEVPKIHRAPPDFYSIDEARAILAATMLHHPAFVRFLVLRFFAGIRRAEFIRMLPDDIDLKQRIINLPGTRKIRGRMTRVTKSGKGRLIQNLPPVIWKWLERYPEMKSDAHRRTFQFIFEASHVRQKKNGFRHSFPTYHVALKQSAAHTILILGQEEDSKAFYTHYFNPQITKEKAKAFFSLGPENVVPWISAE